MNSSAHVTSPINVYACLGACRCLHLSACCTVNTGSILPKYCKFDLKQKNLNTGEQLTTPEKARKKTFRINTEVLKINEIIRK